MRLLLAEDEKHLSKALVTLLKYNNYSVDAVYNGQDALDYLETGIYDGVILDIMMPKLDGISVLKELRARGNNVPVLMLTAKSEIEDKCLGLDLGADDYLTKPFSTKELISRIRAMIRRKSEPVQDKLSLGNLTLDRAAYELSTAFGQVKLTAKEFQIIELMLLAPKTVISIEQLMVKVWGYDTEVDFNIVWVYVSYLRKKLKQIKANVEIVSSRNAGYYLEQVND